MKHTFCLQELAVLVSVRVTLLLRWLVEINSGVVEQAHYTSRLQIEEVVRAACHIMHRNLDAERGRGGTSLKSSDSR